MDIVADILEKSAQDTDKFKSITVEKNLPVEIDLGTLLLADSNDLDISALKKNRSDYILNLTRDNTQLLCNSIWELPSEQVEEAIVVKLPEPKFVLPRARAIPKPKTLSKWQQFAKDKGIQQKKKSKLLWDEQLKKWIPTFGYRRAAAQRERDWVIEVPNNVNPNTNMFEQKKEAKTERVAKNEFQRLRNVAKQRGVKVPRFGVTNSDHSNSAQLLTAATVARSSTASLGKFQDRLPKEKDARGRGVTDLIPGVKRKRKPPPVNAAEERKENMSTIDSILNKRPVLDLEKAVGRQIYEEQQQRSEEKRETKPKAGRNGKKKASKKGGKLKGRGAAKPKGGKGKHTKGGGSRKRR